MNAQYVRSLVYVRCEARKQRTDIETLKALTSKPKDDKDICLKNRWREFFSLFWCVAKLLIWKSDWPKEFKSKERKTCM